MSDFSSGHDLEALEFSRVLFRSALREHVGVSAGAGGGQCLEQVGLSVPVRNAESLGRPGGSVSYVSDFGSGHDLPVRGFEPRVGLCADSSEPEACFRFYVSLSLCSSPAHVLSLSPSKINKNIKKKKKQT